VSGNAVRRPSPLASRMTSPLQASLLKAFLKSSTRARLMRRPSARMAPPLLLAIIEAACAGPRVAAPKRGLVSAPVPATVVRVNFRGPARVRVIANETAPLVALRRYRLAAVLSLNLMATLLANLPLVTTTSAIPRTLLR